MTSLQPKHNIMKKILLILIAALTALTSAAQTTAKEILTKISQSKDCPFSKEVFDNINWDKGNNPDNRFTFHGENNATDYALGWFNNNKGGQTAMLIGSTINMNFETASFDIKCTMTSWLYKGGKAKLIPNSDVITMPKLEDFYTNTADFPKNLYDALTDAVSNNSLYGINNDGDFTVTFIPTFNFDDEQMQGFDKVKKMPELQYTWSGTKLIPKDGNKIYDLDLNYFGVENYTLKNPENIVMEVWKKYFEFDPFGLEIPAEEYIETYLGDVRLDSRTVATYGIVQTLTLACYPYKKGGWYVIEYMVTDEVNQVAAYTYIDGQMQPTDILPPVDEESVTTREPEWITLDVLYTLKNFTADGYETEYLNLSDHSDPDIKYSTTNTTYKWDGEQFVKQDSVEKVYKYD